MKKFQLYLFVLAMIFGGCAKSDHDHPELENQYEPPAAHEMIITTADWGGGQDYNPDVPFITQDLVDNAIIMLYVYLGDPTDTAPYSDYWGPVPSPYHEIAYFDYAVGELWLESDFTLTYDHLIRLVPILHRDYAELDEMGLLNDMDAVLDYTQK
jgi:hypothetical protein